MINRLHLAMIDLYGADAKRIQHFCKVHSYAKLIAEAVDDEMGEDYAKLAGLTAEEDLTNINRILDLLDEDDDVQEVYHNWDE